MGGKARRTFFQGKVGRRRPKSGEFLITETGADAYAPVITGHAVAANEPEQAG